MSDKAPTVLVTDDAGQETRFKATVRIDTQIEVEYYRHGGILAYVLRKFLMGQSGGSQS